MVWQVLLNLIRPLVPVLVGIGLGTVLSTLAQAGGVPPEWAQFLASLAQLFQAITPLLFVITLIQLIRDIVSGLTVGR